MTPAGATGEAMIGIPLWLLGLIVGVVSTIILFEFAEAADCLLNRFSVAKTHAYHSFS